ncbi:MAG: hypothetical protein DVB23_001436 [Verrucomicrobia bacterium]|nr:MAG: hypothetical protein DVB23_001436 [Verrucomicrobiota bacterium]
MRNRLLFVVATSIALWPAPGLAEGSCSWIDVTPILDSQPGLRAFLESTFQISPGGSAMRLGKEFESLEGRRVGPYRFDATSRQDSKLTLELVIETAAEFIDEKGAVLPAANQPAGVVVRERFAAIRLEPIPDEANPNEDLTKAQQTERLAWTKSRCDQLHLSDHKIRTLDFPPGEAVSGKAIYHHDPASNDLQYFTIDATSDTGIGLSESFYFQGGELFFALRRQTPAAAHQPGSELRLYLQNGRIFAAFRKVIPPQGTVLPPVMDEPVQLPPNESNKLLVRVSRLALASDPAEVAADCANLLNAPGN